MESVRSGPAAGPAAQLILLGMLVGTGGLGWSGWAVGLCCAAVLDLLLDRAMAHHGVRHLGPADVVTLLRASLTCGVAAIVADGYAGRSLTAVLVALAGAALVLDAVDGCVARRTGTVSSLGARFDMEVDAFLILVLAVHLASDVGGWVLAAGLARYALVAVRAMAPRLRGSVPPRRWRKVVAAAQGVALTVGAAGVLPQSWTRGVLVAALGALAVSMGTESRQLWREGEPAPRLVAVLDG